MACTMFHKTNRILDRLVVLTVGLGPLFLASLFCVLFHLDFVIWMLLMIPVGVVSGILTLLPQVRAARIRILRLKYPPDD